MTEATLKSIDLHVLNQDVDVVVAVDPHVAAPAEDAVLEDHVVGGTQRRPVVGELRRADIRLERLVAERDDRVRAGKDLGILPFGRQDVSEDRLCLLERQE